MKIRRIESRVVVRVSGGIAEPATVPAFRAKVEIEVRLHGELADKFCVSLKTLNAKFHSSIHKSVGEAIRSACLEGVRDMVENSDIPFVEIASRCGQQSAAHLAFAFHKRYGKTMTEMRNSAR